MTNDFQKRKPREAGKKSGAPVIFFGLFRRGGGGGLRREGFQKQLFSDHNSMISALFKIQRLRRRGQSTGSQFWPVHMS